MKTGTKYTQISRYGLSVGTGNASAVSSNVVCEGKLDDGSTIRVALYYKNINGCHVFQDHNGKVESVAFPSAPFPMEAGASMKECLMKHLLKCFCKDGKSGLDGMMKGIFKIYWKKQQGKGRRRKKGHDAFVEFLEGLEDESETKFGIKKKHNPIEEIQTCYIELAHQTN